MGRKIRQKWKHGQNGKSNQTLKMEQKNWKIEKTDNWKKIEK